MLATSLNPCLHPPFEAVVQRKQATGQQGSGGLSMILAWQPHYLNAVENGMVSRDMVEP